MFGKDLVIHCLIKHGFDPSLELTEEWLASFRADIQQQNKLREALNYTIAVVQNELNPTAKGFIVTDARISEKKDIDNSSKLKDVTYDYFEPIKFLQYQKQHLIEFDDFDSAVDEYFSKVESQKEKKQVL